MFRDSVTLEQFVSGSLRPVLLHEIGHGFVNDNAYRDPNDRNIVLCHELVKHIANVGYAVGFR